MEPWQRIQPKLRQSNDVSVEREGLRDFDALVAFSTLSMHFIFTTPSQSIIVVVHHSYYINTRTESHLIQVLSLKASLLFMSQYSSHLAGQNLKVAILRSSGIVTCLKHIT